MKILKNKIIVFTVLSLIVLAGILLVLKTKKPIVNTEKTEITETQEFLLTFPDPGEPSSDGSSPNEIIDLVLAGINDGDAKISCGLKGDSTKFKITDKEGYRDLSRSIDLNGDGMEEMLVMPIEVCDNVIRGASGNGPIYIFQKKDDTWVNIGEVLGNLLRVRYEKTNNYYNIETNYHMSACSGVKYLYSNQITNSNESNGMYQQLSENDYNHCEN